jgi:uncharacterized cupredoxin-like copper-binding protein
MRAGDMKKASSFIFAAINLFAFLAACSGPKGPSKSLDVTMTDFAFLPNTFIVPAGEQISFSATNNGAVTHSFIIMKSGVQVMSHFTDKDKPNIYWEVEQIAPGQSVRGMFTSPYDPGQYQIICGVAGHFEAGMVAKLTVVKQP